MKVEITSNFVHKSKKLQVFRLVYFVQLKARQAFEINAKLNWLSHVSLKGFSLTPSVSASFRFFILTSLSLFRCRKIYLKAQSKYCIWCHQNTLNFFDCFYWYCFSPTIFRTIFCSITLSFYSHTRNFNDFLNKTAPDFHSLDRNEFSLRFSYRPLRHLYLQKTNWNCNNWGVDIGGVTRKRYVRALTAELLSNYNYEHKKNYKI